MRTVEEIRREVASCEQRLNDRRPKYVQQYLLARIEALNWTLGAAPLTSELADDDPGRTG